MKDFKPNRKMGHGEPTNMCWGGAMKKAKGGYAEGGMRSESTQMARASRDLSDAYDDAKPSYNPIKNIGEIISGRAMEKGANLSNALDRKKRAEQETGGYKKGGYAEGGPKDDKNSVSERQPNVLKLSPNDKYSVVDVPGVGSRLQRKTFTQLLDEGYYDHDPMKKAKGGMAKGGNWIAGATKNKGALHRDLGVPMGQKIPASKLAKAEHSSNPTIAKRARLAKTLASFK